MPRGAAVPLVAAVLVAVALWKTPGTLHSALSVARDGSSTSRVDRELLPAHVVGVQDDSIFLRVAQLMPERATYGVELSANAPADVSAGGEVVAFLNYWLLPRRPVPITAPQDYTIYIGTAPQLPKAKRVTTIVPGFTLVQDR